MPRSASKPKVIKPKQTERKSFVCCSCGKAYDRQDRNFSASQSPLYAGNGYRLPICRHCIDKLFAHYTEILGDEESAIRRICSKFDIYYNPTLAEASRKISYDRSRVQCYISRANLMQYKGKTYDTTLDEEGRYIITSMEDLHEQNSRLAEDEGDEGAAPPAAPIVSQEDIKRWGFGKEPKDYQWLNDKYDEMRSTNVIDTTMRDELVRDYCVQKLLQQSALSEGKIDLYNKLADTAQKTLDRANLTPKIEDAADKAGEKPLGVMIQMFEKENPIPEPRPEWRDVDGIVRLFTVYFLGHLMKMMGLKNRYAALYEAEMDRYRAELPAMQEADDEDIFEYLANGEGAFGEAPAERGG